MLNSRLSEVTALASATGQGGTPAWVTSLIAAGAAIAAALVTALSAAYVARRKVAELELTNTFDLSKQYLESARNYTQGVYLPLSVEVYKLQDSFLAYKAAGKPVERSSPGEPNSVRERFENTCQLFTGEMRMRFYQGAGAVLTIRLDKDITAFVSFLQESVNIEEVIQERSIPKIVRTLAQLAARLTLTSASIIIPAIGIAANVSTGALLSFGSGTSVEQEVVAAPIMSDEFEEQFTSFIFSIKLGIKQVTLGGFKE